MPHFSFSSSCEKPLSMQEALDKADLWWSASEVRLVHPDTQAVQLFIEWMRALRIGRKRVHDTLLAATYLSAGIKEIVTSRVRSAHMDGMTMIPSPPDSLTTRRTDSRMLG
jgi:hypothetical protein